MVFVDAETSFFLRSYNKCVGNIQAQRRLLSPAQELYYKLNALVDKQLLISWEDLDVLDQVTWMEAYLGLKGYVYELPSGRLAISQIPLTTDDEHPYNDA